MEIGPDLHELWRVQLWLTPSTYELMRLHASIDGLSETQVLSRGIAIRRHLEEVRDGTIDAAKSFFTAVAAGEILSANFALTMQANTQARVVGNSMVPWIVDFRPKLYEDIQLAFQHEGFDGMSDYARAALLLYDANSSYYS